MLAANVLRAQMDNAAVLADWLLFHDGLAHPTDPTQALICAQATQLLHDIVAMENQPLPTADTLYQIQQRYHRLIMRPIFCTCDEYHSQAICDEAKEVANAIDLILIRLATDTRIHPVETPVNIRVAA